MYQIGDLVCYPMHGVSTIEEIVSQRVFEEDKQYYVLRFVVGRMTAMVPVDTAETVGLRPLSDAETCEQVMLFLNDGVYRQESGNWNQRSRDNMEFLRRGDVYSVAEVVKSLHRREQLKGLSGGERKLYHTAKQVLFGEIATVCGCTEEELEARLK